MRNYHLFINIIINRVIRIIAISLKKIVPSRFHIVLSLYILTSINIDPNRYHCPYKDCIRSSGLETRMYEHIREVHDSQFPRVKIKAERIVTTFAGEKVDFSSEFLIC